MLIYVTLVLCSWCGKRGELPPLSPKNLEEQRTEWTNRLMGSGLSVWKKRQKIGSKGLSLHPHPTKKNRFPFGRVRDKMYILYKHSKHLVKIITFVYGLGTRDSQ